MSSISMLQKAGTSFLPSSLATKNQLPVWTNGDDHYSSGKTKKTSSSPDVSNDEILPKGGIRRRLSALSLNNLQDYSIPSKGSFSSMRSKSSQGLEHARSSIRKWWDLGWSWILISRKPAFAQDDVEMNDQETSFFLASHNKGSWLHLFYKLRSEFHKILSFRSSSNLTLPQTFKYDHMNNGVKNKESSSITSISFPSGGGR